MVSMNEIMIRSEIRSGDLGHIMYRHGALYHAEYGYGLSFEAYVGYGLFEFYKNYDPSLDRLWMAEHNGQIQGTILLMHREKDVAQLRFFLLEPPYRGIGLGNKLMILFMDFLKEKNYRHAYLWTTEEQKKAATLYHHYGFRLTEEKHSLAFGKPLMEQRYDLSVIQ
jgi:peptidyl-dipeptidase Dcp